MHITVKPCFIAHHSPQLTTKLAYCHLFTMQISAMQNSLIKAPNLLTAICHSFQNTNIHFYAQIPA